MKMNTYYRKEVALIIIILSFLSFSTYGFGFSINNENIQPINLNENILYVGGNGPNNYSKIKVAIADANAGDTVFVYNDSSPYFERDSHINKAIDLVGEDKNTTAIIGDSHWESNIIKITADFATVSGFTIRKSGGGIANILTRTKGGIYIQGANNIEIFENIVEDNGGEGICLRGSHNCIVQDNIIRKNDFRGILVFCGCKDVLITRNTIQKNHKSNLYVKDVDRLTLVENNILNITDFVVFTNTYNTTVKRNNFHRKHGGIECEFEFIDNATSMHPLGVYFDYLKLKIKSRSLKFDANYWSKSRILPYHPRVDFT